MNEPPTAENSYTAVAGDSRWNIAAERLGNGSHYPEIIAAKPGTLKDEHAAIHPGDVPIIPE